MNNDLISRKWLTDAIRNRKTYLSYEDAKDVIDLIDNAPTVETFTKDDMAGAYNEGYACGNRENERPQGEWQPDMDSFYCDQCGVTALEINRKWYKSNFCPNCGAKMKGGE